MRKIAAILLLSLYTFNLVGYHVLFHLLEKKAEQNLQASLDKKVFSDADLVTLRIPLHLPYISDTRSFEKVDGEITSNGKIYHFVKRAIRNGTLVLLCLPDKQKTQLESIKGVFSKQAADDQDSSPSKKHGDRNANLVKSFRAKYLTCKEERADLPLTKETSHFSSWSENLPGQPTSRPKQPPKLS